MNNYYGTQTQPYVNPNTYVGFTNQPAEDIQMTQALTIAEQDELRQIKPEFDGKLSRPEYLKAICTHKDARNHRISLVENPDKTVTCTICGATFNLLNAETEEDMHNIDTTCDNFYDIFQTIKTMYGPIPPEVAKQLYVICGFIKKTPGMYRYAKKYFDKLGVGSDTRTFGAGNPAINAFNNLFGAYGNMQGFGMAPMSPAMMQQQNQYLAQQQAALQQQQAYLAQQQQQAAAMGMQQQPMGMPPMGTVNYNAPVAGNGIGYVVPEAGPATKTVDAKATTISSPDVNAGFKN